MLLFTAGIIIVFGQIRFDRTSRYFAEFSDVSGLRPGQFVRASGVEVGKVDAVKIVDGGHRVRVDFNVDESISLFRDTTAAIRYLDLVGNRYLELTRGHDNRRLPPDGLIPLTHTEPALDLDALIGGFRPLFRSLEPDKINAIAQSIITMFQGQGGTINDILDQTAQLTAAIADRDKAIGQVITNLNTVLATTVVHQQQFDETISKFDALVTGLKSQADPLADSVAQISDAAGTVADLLSTNRPQLHRTVDTLDAAEQPLVTDIDRFNDTLTKLPNDLKIIGRAGGVYGDFFNFYLCDISLKVNGLQPGGPIRTVRLFSQPTGRCTPQ